MAAQYNALDYQQQNPSSQYLPTTAQQHPSPYGAADPYYNQSTGFITPQTAPPAKKGVSKWVKIGVPVLILLIIAGVVGGVLGSRNKSDDSSSSTSSGTKGDTNNPTGTAKGGGSTPSANIGRFAVATDSQYLIPIYPATVCLFFVTLMVLVFIVGVSIIHPVDQHRCLHQAHEVVLQGNMAQRPSDLCQP